MVVLFVGLKLNINLLIKILREMFGEKIIIIILGN